MAFSTNLLSLIVIVIGICYSAADTGGETAVERPACMEEGITRSYILRKITIDSTHTEYIYFVPNEYEALKTIVWKDCPTATTFGECALDSEHQDAKMFRFVDDHCSLTDDSYTDFSCYASCEESDSGVYIIKNCEVPVENFGPPSGHFGPPSGHFGPPSGHFGPPTEPETITEAGPTSAIMPGGVVIAGGYDGGYRNDFETFSAPGFPDLPYKVNSHTLSLVGVKLFMCGGLRSWFRNVNHCFSLDTSDSSSTWVRLDNNLPENIFKHTASVIGDHIWLSFKSKLYDLNTVTGKFETIVLPFYASTSSCAVSNDTHSYHIGAGSNRNEIWVNNDASHPENWHKVATLSKNRERHGCLWLNYKVYITGGYYARADGEVLDTNTHSMSKIGPLIEGRHRHGMLVVNDRPAVISGWTGSGFTDSVETYDVDAGKWEVDSLKLEKARESFGLAQRRKTEIS